MYEPREQYLMSPGEIFAENERLAAIEVVNAVNEGWRISCERAGIPYEADDGHS